MTAETAPAANGGGRPPSITAVGASEEDDAPRSAADILARVVRVTLGGQEYQLAVLFIAGNERWRAYEDQRTAQLVTEMEATGNDRNQITAVFNSEPEMWLDLLYAYDTDCGKRAGVLPPRDELKERIFEDEPEAAIREVVKAANPKAARGWAKLTVVPPMNGSSQPSNTSPPPTAGRRKRSAKH